jgi:hypothetical protein
MIAFFEELLKDEEVKKAVTIIVIADRGYVSEENIKGFRNAGIGCILMLKKNMNMTVSLVDSNAGQVKRLENYLPSSGRFAMTVKRKMFNDDEKDSWFHIVWDPSLEEADRNELAKEIEGERRRIEKDIERKTLRNKDELKRLSKFFRLEFHEEGTLDVGARGECKDRSRVCHRWLRKERGGNRAASRKMRVHGVHDDPGNDGRGNHGGPFEKGLR